MDEPYDMDGLMAFGISKSCVHDVVTNRTWTHRADGQH